MDRDYNQVFEIIKKRKIFKPFIIILILVIIATVSYFGYLAISKIGQKNYQIYRDSDTYYAVVLKSSSDLVELQSQYTNAVAIGASGYVWQGAEQSHLIALIYPNEEMAKSVIATNTLQNFDLKVEMFDTPKIAYNLEEFEPEDVEIILESTNLIYDLGRALYELTISVQIGNLSSIAGASTINNYKGNIMGYIANIESILNNYTNANVVKLLEKMIKLNNILEKLVNDLLINEEMSNIMKYSFCEYIYELCNN